MNKPRHDLAAQVAKLGADSLLPDWKPPKRIKVDMLKDGDRVTLRWSRKARGKVVSIGPDQSEVLWDGERKTSIYLTEHLVKLVKRQA